MRIVPFPTDEPLPGQETWTAELEAALRGESQRPDARAWRELRDDVRALAPAMTPAFEVRLAQELERRGALEGSAREAETRMHSHDSARSPRRISTGDTSASLSGAFARRRRGSWSLASHRRSALAATATVTVALVATLLILGSHGSTPAVESPAPMQRTPGAALSPGARGPKATAPSSRSSTPTPSATSEGSSASTGAQASPSIAAPSATGAFSAPGRVQQLAASITLDSSPQNLQVTSDQVAQLTVRDGGYVQSSNVQVQRQGASEATLALRLPSARLAAALAAIARLAPVRAENQSLQDITGAYNAAHRQLSDAEAEQRALLHALAAASTEAQIDSLHTRLAASRTAITRAQSSVNSISARASTSEVEVSILGDTRAGNEGLTFHKGFHDAGQILLVVVIAILILAAVLVPLALLIAGVAGTRRTWRRYQRERALDAP
ncbi:MAG TPA: DUF4349 domain-containing protein [Solirubrobacteraceae bacterium]|jgi:hypothetical protein|nr:DUF4349 domain-containing protein [Solirubrobacteraceae bacterium]